MIFYDRLYGDIEFNDFTAKLFQETEMARLRQISLCAVPAHLQPTSACANRFEHSLGVAHLARLLSQRAGFLEISPVLFFAGLLHDIGTPPFSHISEHFQKLIFGQSHEERAAAVLAYSPLAHQLKCRGCSLEKVAALIQGQLAPWGELINGSIDLDNLDNSLRYCLSMGLAQQQYYSPERLVDAFGLEKGKLFIHSDAATDLANWEKCRLRTYDFVYSPTNLAPGMMLFRALDLAYQCNELDREYFMLNDEEALTFLAEKCNSRASTLIRRVRGWKFYIRVFDYRSSDPSPSLKAEAADTLARSRHANALSESLTVQPEDICVLIGKDRGYKKIHLPILDQNHQPVDLPASALAPKWHIQVFVHPPLNTSSIRAKIKQYFAPFTTSPSS